MIGLGPDKNECNLNSVPSLNSQISTKIKQRRDDSRKKVPKDNFFRFWRFSDTPQTGLRQSDTLKWASQLRIKGSHLHA